MTSQEWRKGKLKGRLIGGTLANADGWTLGGVEVPRSGRTYSAILGIQLSRWGDVVSGAHGIVNTTRSRGPLGAKWKYDANPSRTCTTPSPNADYNEKTGIVMQPSKPADDTTTPTPRLPQKKVINSATTIQSSQHLRHAVGLRSLPTIVFLGTNI